MSSWVAYFYDGVGSSSVVFSLSLAQESIAISTSNSNDAYVTLSKFGYDSVIEKDAFSFYLDVSPWPIQTFLV